MSGQTVAWAFGGHDSDTFECAPIRAFIGRYIKPGMVVVDPFARNSRIATHRNDLNPDTDAPSHEDARDFLRRLDREGVVVDAILLDPPYSPRQIKECYDAIGLKCSMTDTQNAVLYAECIEAAHPVLRPGAVALRFGWNSTGFPYRLYERVETLVVNHGAAHNDTICTADIKRRDLFTMEAAF